MRVNIYAEELTDRIEIVSKEIDGVVYTGLRFYLELPVTVPQRYVIDGEESSVGQVRGPFMHKPGDDDSAAVTFWGKRDLRNLLHTAQQRLADYYGEKARGVDAKNESNKVSAAK